MEHLSLETLARLVDDAPDAAEQAHLDSCARCAAELRGLVQQTAALGTLPELMPPRADWDTLEARLRSEGLLRDPSFITRLTGTRTPGWMRVAASVLLFSVGAISGAGWASRTQVAELPGSPVSQVADLDQAAARVQDAERSYVQAMSQYREILARSGGDEEGVDPYSRYAALEHLVLVSQAAVRQAPGDPYLNGFLASAMAERDAAARLVPTSSGGWF